MARTVGQSLGNCIRRRRLDLGLSQVEFAEKAGFYQTYLSRLEQGKANPTLNALEVLSVALKTNIFDLFEEVRLEHSRRTPVAVKAGAPSRGRPRSAR